MTDEQKKSRAQKAASARWCGRGTSAVIRVDREAADALLELPQGERRTVASAAIRRAVDELRRV